MADEQRIDQILSSVAASVLGISLEVRNSDRYDFHDLSVLSIKSALRAAYIAGYDDGKDV